MKLYIITTGAVFALITLAHVARVMVEGTGPLEDPVFVIATIASIALCAWSVVVLRQIRRLRS